ncbi:WD domain-containing protein [Paecilomyces variotii No. 5]|uniref:WD domain-containing protein n=1 Tax=Byssochlamys spectabilis (strain No. 5 / NBRC 109023) TaxID=1356009 RepID=V5G5M2_BYSSN|nr:WD domain-containing protein [Paecilomyces variotii No. 5]
MAIPLCSFLEETCLSKGHLSSVPFQITVSTEDDNGHITTTEPSPVLSSQSSSSSDEFHSLQSSGEASARAPTPPCDETNIFQDSAITVDHSIISDILSAPETTPERLQRKAVTGRRCVSAVAALNTPNSPRSPDRFIPARASFDAPTTPFRLSKAPRHMSPEERFHRRRDHSADPFMPSRPRRAASVPRRRTQEHRYSSHYLPHLVNDAAALRGNGTFGLNDALRQISAGAVWNVGGSSAATGSSPVGISDGTGGLLGSGTTAPMYIAKFLEKTTPAEERERHEARLVLALDIDQATRLLDICRVSPRLESRPSPSSPNYERYSPITWKDNAWKRAEGVKRSGSIPKGSRQRAVPTLPFRVLDAPLLRDDFYCSTLAYSYTAGILAVGLSSHVYLWSEVIGVQYPPFANQPPTNYVTSLSFSSARGGRSILVVGRQGGLVSLWSTFDSEVRFEISQPNAVSCVAFKPTPSIRLSERFTSTEVEVEDLVVGDDLGNVWYYSVEWPDNVSRDAHHWNGSMTLIAKISAHTQQICGLAWSPDGRFLATGGNDNACLLFELRDILLSSRSEASARSSTNSRLSNDQPQSTLSRLAAHAHLNRLFDRHYRLSQFLPSWGPTQGSGLSPSVLVRTGSLISGRGRTLLIPSNRQKHRLAHSAAVKAIAFAPWQPSLLATGGGSNDRSIHFYHTPSGARLATINVHAQVTSLIWSKTRREIVATFGYAQPEHPFRIAVFAWPSCEQVVAIPWNVNGSGEPASNSNSDCGRALWAISYPGGPNDSVSCILPESVSERESSSATVTPATSGRRSSVHSGLDADDLSPISSHPSAKGKEGGLWWSRTAEEGCIIVVSSDESVKFHEVWSGARKSIGGTSGLLGGSEILEGLEGIEKESNEIIR